MNSAFMRRIPHILALALLFHCAPNQAEIVKSPRNTPGFKTYQQWLSQCADEGEFTAACMAGMNDSQARRTRKSTDVYTLAQASGNPLMTRSGVLLSQNTTNRMGAVLSDRATMSIIETPSGSHCLMYATYGRGENEQSRSRQLDSFVKFINDTPTDRAELHAVQRLENRTELHFSSKDRDLYGTLIADPEKNADIWVACVNNSPEELQNSSAQLTSLILGSGRQY